MTDTDVKPLPNTSLSADAKSFVPNHLKGAQGTGPVSTHTGQNITQGLPKYMTNCYPFVQHDVHYRPSISGSPGSWQQPRSAVQRNSFAGAMFSSQQASPRMPGMQNFSQRFPRPQTYPRTSTGPQPPPVISALQMQCPPPALPSPQQQQQHSPIPPNYISSPYQVSPGPVTPPNWMSPPPHMPFAHDQGYYGQGLLGQPPPGDDYAPTGPMAKPHPGDRHKNKKKRGEWSNMVSVGIQNEAALHNHALGMAAPSGSTKKKNKPKTIMCMDAAIQTDFSDELANKTLLEKPSSLYQQDRSRNYLRLYQDSTTDSEVDSDSGYSSPMHRRNQASNGTHPLTATIRYVPPPVGGSAYPPLSAAIGVPPTSVFSGYAQAVAGGFPTVPNIRHAPPVSAYSTGISAHNQIPSAGALRRNKTDKGRNTFEKTSIQRTSNPSRLPSPVKQRYSAVVSSNASKSDVTNSHPSSYPSQSAENQRNILIERNQNTGTDANLTPEGSSRPKTEGEEDEGASSSGSKPKRKRNRRRKKRSEGSGSPERQGAFSDGPYDLVRAQSSSNVSRTSTVENEILHFEDENEFPNLLSAVGGLQSEQSAQNPSVSYCDILKGQVVPHLSQDSAHSYSSGGGLKSSPESAHVKGSVEAKNARKKRKRREAIDKAADAELAEITLEQQVLRELSAQSQSENKKKGGKRSSQPISVNIADMISALEKQQEHQRDHPSANTSAQKITKPHARKDISKVANMLDSSAPVKRGKEREVPKAKKPSPLKKVILKEREEKKRLRLLEDGVTVDVTAEMDDVNGASEDQQNDEENLSPEAGSKSTLEINADASADLSPISQTSPISMSPLSGSPLNSGFNSPIANQTSLGNNASSSVLSRIHSRRFREYCNQVLDKDIDNCCMLLLQELVRFQDRLYHRDPNKAKSKRRIVLGLREVTKHLKMNKIKCVIISPNLERIQSKGGLDEALNNIIVIAQEQTVPVVFALGRRALGRACAKLVPVSVVGIFNYEGCDEYFKNLMDMTKKARDAYLEMVTAMEKEIHEIGRSSQPPANVISTIADVPKFFSHMGHSRTPSGCSGISLTSSILSEPISENYPYSEPETDSRGYEIVRSKYSPSKTKVEGTGETLEEKLQKIESDLKDLEEQERTQSPNSSADEGKVCIVESLCEIDEGNEADTEDDVIKRVRAGDSTELEGQSEERPVNSDLPPFDSIHTSPVDGVGVENAVAAGDSAKEASLPAKVDHNTEALSAHSSKTPEAGRCTPDRLSRNVGAVSDLREVSTGSGSSAQHKAMDKERIEEWVAKTQKQVEMLSMGEGGPIGVGPGEDKCEAAVDDEYADNMSDRLSGDVSVGDNEDSINECVDNARDKTPAEPGSSQVT